MALNINDTPLIDEGLLTNEELFGEDYTSPYSVVPDGLPNVYDEGPIADVGPPLVEGQDYNEQPSVEHTDFIGDVGSQEPPTNPSIASAQSLRDKVQAQMDQFNGETLGVDQESIWKSPNAWFAAAQSLSQADGSRSPLQDITSALAAMGMQQSSDRSASAERLQKAREAKLAEQLGLAELGLKEDESNLAREKFEYEKTQTGFDPQDVIVDPNGQPVGQIRFNPNTGMPQAMDFDGNPLVGEGYMAKSTWEKLMEEDGSGSGSGGKGDKGSGQYLPDFIVQNEDGTFNINDAGLNISKKDFEKGVGTPDIGAGGELTGKIGRIGSQVGKLGVGDPAAETTREKTRITSRNLGIKRVLARQGEQDGRLSVYELEDVQKVLRDITDTDPVAVNKLNQQMGMLNTSIQGIFDEWQQAIARDDNSGVRNKLSRLRHLLTQRTFVQAELNIFARQMGSDKVDQATDDLNDLTQ